MARSEKEDPRSGLCCKHFAAYDRNKGGDFSANVSARSMWETYMPAFERCVVEAQATHVMCSYNSLLGKPTCWNEGRANAPFCGTSVDAESEL